MSNKILALILGISLFSVYLFSINLYPLVDEDEGAFASATMTMMDSGNFANVELAGERRDDKPVLTHWLQVISLKTFGFSEFAFRLPSVIFGLLWAFVTFWFTKKISNKRNAFLAAFFVLASLGASIIIKTATADGIFNFFVASTTLLAFLALREQRTKYLYYAAILAGFGFLTKGPAILIVPGGALFFWAWWNGYLTETLRKLFNPFLWLVFFCIASPWFIYLYLSEGIDPILGFFLKHNFQRYTSTFEGHSGPFYYYLVILIFLVAPFWNSLFTVVGRIKTDFKDETRSFLWIWFLWVLLFFSISSTKLPHYLLYGITPLFILMALNFKQQSKRINLLIFISLLGFISSMPIVLETLASSEKDIIWNFLIEDIEVFFSPANFFIPILILLVLGIISFMILSKFNQFIISSLLFLISIHLIFLPSAIGLFQDRFKQAGLKVKEMNKPLAMHKMNFPSFGVYARDTAYRNHNDGKIILLRSNQIDELGSVTEIYNRSGISVVIKE